MAKTAGEKEQAKQERIEVSVATPEETEQLRGEYLRGPRKPPIIIDSGNFLHLEIMGLAVEGDEIRCSIKPTGGARRPGKLATAKPELVHLVIKATVEVTDAEDGA